MNFNKIFVFVALILAISLGQSDAGWLKKIGKKIVSSLKGWRNIVTNYIHIYVYLYTQERVGQHTRDATIQGLGIAQQAANVAATARG